MRKASNYPAFSNNNGLGGLGQQAMREYWENYAKSVDPLNFQRKISMKAEETHSETVTDKANLQKNRVFYRFFRKDREKRTKCQGKPQQTEGRDTKVQRSRENQGFSFKFI